MDKKTKGIFQSILFFILSIVVGAYSEFTAISSASIATIIIILYAIKNGGKVNKTMCLSLTLVIVGFIFLLTAPAEGAKLKGSINTEGLLDNIKTILYLYRDFWILVVATTVLLVVAVTKKADKETTIVGFVLVFVALSISVSLCVASYVPDRGFTIPVILYISTCAILAVELYNDEKTMAMLTYTLPILASLFFVVWGVSEIIDTDYRIRLNEQYIIADVNAGKTTSYIDNVASITKYPAVYNLKYISVDPDDWPNDSMTLYYGIDRIIGKK